MVMNDGTVLRAPSAVASPTCGFWNGLEPPTAGWAWQAAQLREVERGPRPTPSSPERAPATESTSRKRSLASLKKLRMVAGLLASTEERALPAPAAPPRTPGSDCAIKGMVRRDTRTAMSTIRRDMASSSIKSRETGANPNGRRRGGRRLMPERLNLHEEESAVR